MRTITQYERIKVSYGHAMTMLRPRNGGLSTWRTKGAIVGFPAPNRNKEDIFGDSDGESSTFVPFLYRVW